MYLLKLKKEYKNNTYAVQEICGIIIPKSDGTMWPLLPRVTWFAKPSGAPNTGRLYLCNFLPVWENWLKTDLVYVTMNICSNMCSLSLACSDDERGVGHERTNHQASGSCDWPRSAADHSLYRSSSGTALSGPFFIRFFHYYYLLAFRCRDRQRFPEPFFPIMPIRLRSIGIASG